jgi:3-oxo-5alpha-steroid 4-dehydrogenase
MSVTDEQFYDVVVIGFGGAGACAAIEAAEAGRSVLVLDRFYGGGATVLSGGVVYAGGGTAQQKEAGVEDTPENMLAYLRAEVAGVVSEETLRDFAYGSREMIDWLERHGAEFDGSLCPYKTSYPTNRHYLYFSGNEQVRSDVAVPAPRGHRVRARNFSGKAFFTALHESAVRAGVEIRPLATARRLLVEDGAVVGVEFTAPAAGASVRGGHAALTGAAHKMTNWYPPVGRLLHRLAALSSPRTRTWRVRAGGVVLSGGGYAHDDAFLRQHAPQFLGLGPLGTVGDDGSAIRLGTAVGGALGHMSGASGWRFVSPPSGFARGVLVGGDGTRVGNEQLYGATLSDSLIRDHGAHGFLVVGDDAWRAARAQVREQAAFFNLPQLLYWFSPLGHVIAADPAELAAAIGVDAAALYDTLTGYDLAIQKGEPDPHGKHDELRTPLLGAGPLRAIDCSAGTPAVVPFPFMTLGGLVVEERTGALRRSDGSVVPGVYAAGRSAVGLCSTSYVSGLSLADAVYSGRRAGRHAAQAAPGRAGRTAGAVVRHIEP